MRCSLFAFRCSHVHSISGRYSSFSFVLIRVPISVNSRPTFAPTCFPFVRYSRLEKQIANNYSSLATGGYWNYQKKFSFLKEAQ